MKQFFKWLGKHIAGALVFSLFSILFIAGIVYALTFPSTPPVGEVAGGKFMQYFNSIKVACPAGQYLNGYDANFVKQCATVPAGPAGANGTTGPQGATGLAGMNGLPGAPGPVGPAGASGSPDSGTVCGYTAIDFHLVTHVWSTVISTCKGYNPATSCPLGYTRHTTASYGSAHFNAAWCTKN
ncbi:MAG: collagen-like protein [Candidatus Gracilibacteria bacterium]